MMFLLLLLVLLGIRALRGGGGAGKDEGEIGGEKSPPESEFSTNPEEQITPHFKASEFLCPCGECRASFRIHRRLVYLLEAVVRGPLGLPVVVNSGYRCPSYNRTLKGAARNSYHMRGMAADVHISGLDPQDLQSMAYVSWYMGKLGGLGLYDRYIHLDTGEVRLWDKRSPKQP